MRTVYICGKCGQRASGGNIRTWLVGQRKDKPLGHLVIRCPNCVTNYAKQLVK